MLKSFLLAAAIVAGCATPSFSAGTDPIRVNVPAASATWPIGGPQTLRWTDDSAAASAVKIELSRDGGSTWQALATSVRSNIATNTFTWKVEGPTTTRGKIRITSLESAATGVSLGQFSILEPSISVRLPDARSRWRAGDAQAIQIAHTLGVGQTISVEVSRDGGIAWSPATTFTTVAAATARIPWTPAGPPTPAARLRASWAADKGVSATTAAPFTILGRITVDAPNTHVSWKAGTTHAIKWSGSLATTDRVSIALSRNDGTTWEPVASSIPNSGTFSWAISGPAATNARIRVSRTIDATEYDVSDVSFRID